MDLTRFAANRCPATVSIEASAHPTKTAALRNAVLGTGQGVVHDPPGFIDNPVQMCLVLEALGVDLVNVLCAGRTGSKPAAGCHDLQAPNRSVVARGAGQLGRD